MSVKRKEALETIETEILRQIKGMTIREERYNYEIKRVKTSQ